MNVVTVTYPVLRPALGTLSQGQSGRTCAGDERAVVESSGGRTFVVDQRVNIGREGAKFCPIELIAASLGA